MPATPQTEARFDFTSGARGQAPGKSRVAILGAKITAGLLAVNTPKLILDEAEGDLQAGKGSEAALNIRAFFKAAKAYLAKFSGINRIEMPEVWLVVGTDPGGGAKATYTITVTGPATESGELDIRIAGRQVLVPVTSGDVQNNIAAAISAKVNTFPTEMPVVATVATNVVTLTAVNAGVNSNDIRVPKQKGKPVAGVSLAFATGVAGAGTFDIDPLLAVLVDKRYHSVVTSNHASGDITKLKTWIDSRNLSTVKHWPYTHVGEYGTISTGTTLTIASNYEQVIVSGAEGIPRMPGEVAAQVAAVFEIDGRRQLSFNGVELPLEPPDPVDVHSPAEIETGLSNGYNVLDLSVGRDKMRIRRLVTTRTLNGGVAFDKLLDANKSRRAFDIAEDIDGLVRQQYEREPNDANTAGDVVSDIIARLRFYELERWIANVETHKAGITTTKPTPTTLDVTVPLEIGEHLHNLRMSYVLQSPV